MSILVAIIYLAFISLGLPDSLLGSGWPVMHLELNASLSSAGIISLIISASTVVSAMVSDRLTRKLGTGVLTAASVLLTSLAMMGFSFSKEFYMLCLIAVPYGFGAGAIDACLNNYVALHLSSRHMSFLHCCWGVGATVSPYIMSFAISSTLGWQGGYRVVSIIQLVLAIIMFVSLPLWKKDTDNSENSDKTDTPSLSLKQIFKIPGTALIFIAFFVYCLIEILPIVWASSYFSDIYNLAPEKAALFGSLFYIGMTVGRAGIGIFANKIGDKILIRMGTIWIFVSMLIVFIPFENYIFALVGFILMGLGCAPIYPAMVHSSPNNFGRDNSQSVIGVQMAFAYMGFTLSPIAFGKIAEHISISLLPYIIFALSCILLFTTEKANKSIAKAKEKTL